MEIVLDKKGLVSLVVGMPPYYSLMEHLTQKGLGSYCGGFNDNWSWNSTTLNTMTEAELFELYESCRDSWK